MGPVGRHPSAIVGIRPWPERGRERGRGAREREGGGVDRPDRLRPWAEKGGARPSKQEKRFPFLFSNPNFTNSHKFKILK
jgi:hypothetical protein